MCIRDSINGDMRILLGNGGRNFIDKHQQRTGMASLIIVDGLALFALAGVIPVILADRYNGCLGICLLYTSRCV